MDETPKMKCNKEFLISDGGMTIPTLTLAPMGMVAPGGCQELQIFGKKIVPSSIGLWSPQFDKSTQDY